MIQRGTWVRIKRHRLKGKSWTIGKIGQVTHQAKEGATINKKWYGMQKPYPNVWSITIFTSDVRGGYKDVSLHERYLEVIDESVVLHGIT